MRAPFEDTILHTNKNYTDYFFIISRNKYSISAIVFLTILCVSLLVEPLYISGLQPSLRVYRSERLRRLPVHSCSLTSLADVHLKP